MELLISGPEGSSRTVELDKDLLSLGRSADNDLAYPEDPWLSRYHLCFERIDGEWFIKDCASRNGTLVNNTGIRHPRRLRQGDLIHAGHLTIEVRESANPVVSFLAPVEKAKAETIVTDLDKVLRKTEDRVSTTFASNRVIRALIRAGQELAVHRPLGLAFEAILDFSLSAVKARRGVILTLEENGQLVVRASRGEGFAISTAVRDRVLTEKCSLMVSDAQLDNALRQQQSIVLHRVRSMLAVPLQTGSRVIGLIYVDNAAVPHPFTREDLELLTVMANIAAIRIEHARLAAVEQIEQMMEAELAQASEIQRSLLPAGPPPCSGYEIAGYSLPCRSVGGDYYDYLQYEDGRLGLVIGDVSGKGLPAALMVSSLQARIQMLSEMTPEPATAMRALNKSLSQRCPLGTFITFFYALLDPATGRMSYTNAGHNYPLLLRAGGQVERLSEGGTVLGLFANTGYEQHQVQLEPGDLLALYSDGVTEATNAEGREFGEQGLIEFLASHRFARCAEIATGLAECVRRWSGKSSFADDFTIALLRHEGAGA
jgi:sigma-B regulation protein RsbU (phosphoserine phosphatase)